jgi:hypothetical protein
VPTGLPAGSSTMQSRWPALRSTATRGRPAHSARVGTPGEDGSRRRPGTSGPGEQVQPSLLLPAFISADVAADPSGPATDRPSQARLQPPDRPAQAGSLVEQVSVAALPLVLACAGDRPRPATGRGGGQLPLSAGSLVVAVADAAALGQIVAGQPPEVLADLTQHGLVGSREPQPGPDASSHRRCSQPSPPWQLVTGHHVCRTHAHTPLQRTRWLGSSARSLQRAVEHAEKYEERKWERVRQTWSR